MATLPSINLLAPDIGQIWRHKIEKNIILITDVGTGSEVTGRKFWRDKSEELQCDEDDKSLTKKKLMKNFTLVGSLKQYKPLLRS